MTNLPLDDMDPEVRDLVVALNRLPGIKTTESCCGHGKEPFRIWFQWTDHSERGMLTIARVTCPRYAPAGWDVLLYHGDNPEDQVSFLLEGQTGEPAYAAAADLADRINTQVDGTTGCYNILHNCVDPSTGSRS